MDRDVPGIVQFIMDKLGLEANDSDVLKLILETCAVTLAGAAVTLAGVYALWRIWNYLRTGCNNESSTYRAFWLLRRMPMKVLTGQDSSTPRMELYPPSRTDSGGLQGLGHSSVSLRSLKRRIAACIPLKLDPSDQIMQGLRSQSTLLAQGCGPFQQDRIFEMIPLVFQDQRLKLLQLFLSGLQDKR